MYTESKRLISEINFRPPGVRWSSNEERTDVQLAQYSHVIPWPYDILPEHKRNR